MAPAARGVRFVFLNIVHGVGQLDGINDAQSGDCAQGAFPSACPMSGEAFARIPQDEHAGPKATTR